MTGPEYRFGKPFDLLVLCGSQTESGRSLHDISDVAPIVAEAILVLGETPLRDAAGGLANNVLRRLEELTPQGEPTTWGSLGIVDWVFSGQQVARYFAHRCAERLLEARSQGIATSQVTPRLDAAGHANHTADVDELMRFVQEEDGRPRLADYGKEVARSLKGSKVKAKALPDKLRTFEDTFEGRIRVALGQARNAAEEAASGFATSVEREARALVDEAGPAAGLVLTALALKHLSLLQGTLEEQRESLREPVAQAESEMARAFKAVEMEASRSRFGWLRGLRKPLAAYLSAASLAFRLRYAFDLTEAVLAALSQADERLREFQPRLQGMLDRFALVRDRCRRWTQEFESYEPTPVTEIIQRPLYETAQLQRLYRDSYATDWGTTSQEMEGAVRQSLGGLSLWLDSEEQAIYAALIDALLPVFAPTVRMTADDFVRWLSAVGETSAELLLRDSELLAPVLCRYDRGRLPDSGAFEDTAFRILGVPDCDCSAFSGIADVLLVSTGDPDRIVHLSLKLGFPASALWHHERYQRAAEEVRRRGRVAQQIYPDFPYDGRRDPPPDDEHGASGRARGRRRPAQQRPGRPEEGRDER